MLVSCHGVLYGASVLCGGGGVGVIDDRGLLCSRVRKLDSRESRLVSRSCRAPAALGSTARRACRDATSHVHVAVRELAMR